MPTAVLDIYVHESCQRTGIGKVFDMRYSKYPRSFWGSKVKMHRN